MLCLPDVLSIVAPQGKLFFGKLDDSKLSLDANLLKMNGGAFGGRYSQCTIICNSMAFGSTSLVP